jgi:hypothetical protein
MLDKSDNIVGREPLRIASGNEDHHLTCSVGLQLRIGPGSGERSSLRRHCATPVSCMIRRYFLAIWGEGVLTYRRLATARAFKEVVTLRSSGRQVVTGKVAHVS